MSRFWLVSLALGAAAAISGAAAQEFTSLTACRIDAERVAFSLDYMGGACEAPGGAMAEPVGTDTLKVTVSTTRTAEICTLQLVPISASSAVAAGAGIGKLDVTVLNPDGNPQVSGVADIMSPPECMPPELPAEVAPATPPTP